MEFRHAVTAHVIVKRLWHLYAWPELQLPMQSMTVAKLLRYQRRPTYVSDLVRSRKQPSLAWDYGRIRFFYEQLLAGVTLDAIEVDNVCQGGRILPEPQVLDGHHRLAASHLAATEHIAVEYAGRLDLLRYLTGARASVPLK